MSTSENNGQFSIARVEQLETLPQQHLDGTVAVYRRAFARPPYSEDISEVEAAEALQFILDESGDLLIGMQDDTVVSLAGGYFTDERTYFIEELAVDPDTQGQGLGRRTLQRLIDTALETGTDTLEICTSKENVKAISLYESALFVKNPVLKAAPHMRVGGKIELDERVYLTRTENEGTMEKPARIRRAVIAYPSGNTTAIIMDQMLDADRETLNQQVMDAWKKENPGQPEIEQCCFVTLPKDKAAVARVEMFGGEFCGNATRSVIALVTKGQDYTGKIEVSGVDRLLDFSVKDGIVDLQMPVPEEDVTQTVGEGTLVKLDGITHLVVTDPTMLDSSTPRAVLEKLLTDNAYGLADQPAVGVSYYDPETKKSDYAVWVREVKTIFDETACGSGTCSIGIALASTANQGVELEVIQPSDEIIKTTAQIDPSGKVSSRISGEVTMLYDGQLKLA